MRPCTLCGNGHTVSNFAVPGLLFVCASLLHVRAILLNKCWEHGALCHPTALMKAKLLGMQTGSFVHSSHMRAVLRMRLDVVLGPRSGSSPLSRTRMIALVKDMCSVYVLYAVSKPISVACTTPLSPEHSDEEGDMRLRITTRYCWIWARTTSNSGDLRTAVVLSSRTPIDVQAHRL